MTITVNPTLRGAELAQATAEYITEHPEEWNQEHWISANSCGTTACVAGTAVLIVGLRITDEAVPVVAASALGFNYYTNDDIRDLFLGQWYREAEDEVFELPPLLPLNDRLTEMWHRIAGLYPEGAITIPEQYR